MTIKRTIQFDFTQDDCDKIDTFRTFLEELDVDSYETLRDITKGMDLIDAVDSVWTLAFENDGIYDCD